VPWVRHNSMHSGGPFLLSLAASALCICAWMSEDWIRIRASPPHCEHDVRCILGLRSANLAAKLRPDPLHPWEKAPPELHMYGALWAKLEELVDTEAPQRFSAAVMTNTLSTACSCAGMVALAAAATLAGGVCPWFRASRRRPRRRLVAALLMAMVILTHSALLLVSTFCATWVRPWIARLLFVSTGGEAAVWPHYLEVLPGPGVGCFALAGLCGFAAALLVCGRQDEPTSDVRPVTVQAVALQEPIQRPSKDKLVSLAAQRRRELIQEQQQWADTLLVGCAGCFALLLLSSLWVVGQKAVDLGVKDALNKPTWRHGRYHGGLPWHADYREAWRDMKAAGICTGIRTAIRIDDFRKSVQHHADETAQQLKRRLRSKRRQASDEVE